MDIHQLKAKYGYKGGSIIIDQIADRYKALNNTSFGEEVIKRACELSIDLEQALEALK